jgi:transposase
VVVVMMIYLGNRSMLEPISKKEPTRKKETKQTEYLFDYKMYTRVRTNVERFFGWLKSFRRIQTRDDRLTSTYLAFVELGCVTILMRRVFR